MSIDLEAIRKRVDDLRKPPFSSDRAERRFLSHAAEDIEVLLAEITRLKEQDPLAALKDKVVDLAKIMRGGQDWNAWKPQMVPLIDALAAATAKGGLNG